MGSFPIPVFPYLPLPDEELIWKLPVKLLDVKMFRERLAV
jgi:hypothetical protein